MARKRPPAPAPNTDIDRIKAIGRVELNLRIVDYLGRLLIGVVVIIALIVGRPMVHDLAGRDTKVEFVGQLGWGVGAVSSLGWANSARRRKLNERARPAEK